RAPNLAARLLPPPPSNTHRRCAIPLARTPTAPRLPETGSGATRGAQRVTTNRAPPGWWAGDGDAVAGRVPMSAGQDEQVLEKIVERVRTNVRAAGIPITDDDIQGMIDKGFLANVVAFEAIAA